MYFFISNDLMFLICENKVTNNKTLYQLFYAKLFLFIIRFLVVLLFVESPSLMRSRIVSNLAYAKIQCESWFNLVKRREMA